MSSGGLDWKFSQLFGDKSPVEEVTEVDIVSAIEFDETGNYIAAGDRGGRVVIFERTGTKEDNPHGDYKFHAEFQSHEPEFDYLKSLEIEEKINKIKWCKRTNQAHLLLTTNDKTIKLWKVFEKKNKTVQYGDVVGKYKIPQFHETQMDDDEPLVHSTARRVFANAHAYHINSIAINSDGETYISSDDLRINLWNLDISSQSFNIVDIKPTNMEELTEVITAAEFHPQQCNIFMYSSSKGTIKLADLRAAALCDQHSKLFEEEEDPANKSFFSEIISSISDIKFSRDGQYIVARDYLSLKLWDIRKEASPVKTIPIHNNLKSKLCDLYENDCIFDKFETALSHDGEHMLTGSYHNCFSIYDKQGKVTASIEANKTLPKKKKSGKLKKKKEEMSPDAIDFSKKVLHVAWHPHENLIAIGAVSNLFIYNA